MTSVSVILAAAGSALGLFLAVLLFSMPSQAQRANRWLAGLMLSMALVSIQDVLDHARIALADVRFGHLFDWLIFVLGPLSYIYVCRMAGRDRPRGFALIAHAVPALLLALLLLPFWIAPPETKRALLEQDYAMADVTIDWVLVAAVVHVLCYLLAALRVVHEYRRALKERYSAIERIGLRWLSSLLGVNLLMWAVWAVSVLTRSPLADSFDAAALPAGLYVLGLLALRQREVIAPLPETPRTDSRVKYERSALDQQKRARLLAQLENLISCEKPWLENDLTLASLAERAQMSPHHLSQLLNEHIGKNFFDYINELRVREVQRCLRDSQYAETPVLDIALAAGFNSKAAFNAAFKKFTGTTPGAYRRSPSAMPAT